MSHEISSPRPINEVAEELSIASEHLVPYGTDKAKVRLEARAAALKNLDKRGGLMLDYLRDRFVGGYVTMPPSRRADPQMLSELAEAHDLGFEPDPATAVARARQLVGPGGLVVVTGSLYLVGAVLSTLEPSRQDAALSW